jgi:sugar lactone lactonase YvrE
MYWTHGSQGIYRGARDGTEIKLIVAGERINAIAVDAEAGKIYWNIMSDPAARLAQVWSAALDGAGAKLLTKDIHWAGDIVVDPIEHKLYVASLGDGKIVQLNCDGADQKDFLADLPPPRQLAVDVENRKLYWSSNSEHRIDRVNLDGSGREQVVKNMPGVAFGMALDVKGGQIYWAYPGGAIYRSALDGSGHEKLIAELSQPDGLAIDVYNRLMYWAENGKICQATLEGGDRQVLVSGKTSQYSSLEVFPPK